MTDKQPDSPVIKITSLTKEYGRTKVLDMGSWQLDEGALVALVGHNGAGKTTLLTIMAGLTRPTTGRVTINGDLPGSAKARRAVSFVPDHPALFDDLTVAEQMLYVAKLNGAKEPNNFASRLIDQLDASSLVDRFPLGMSKGQRQKAGLLVATARPFKVLLLDEPTTGLDAESRSALIETLSQWSQAGGVVVTSTHDPELIAVSDEVVEMAAGSVLS